MGRSQKQHLFLGTGFDFAYAAQAFFDLDRRIQTDQRHSYGEVRVQLFGRIGPRIFVLVYNLRPDATRIISARKANTQEVKHYENSTHED